MICTHTKNQKKNKGENIKEAIFHVIMCVVSKFELLFFENLFMKSQSLRNKSR
jgi:hypothetical protein